MRPTPRRTRLAIAALGILTASAGLAGCAGGTGTAPAPDAVIGTPAVSSSPAPPTSGSNVDVLFTIKANIRAKDGSTVTVEMVGHAPLPFDAPSITNLKDTFLTLCKAQNGTSVSNAGTPISEQSLADYGSSLMLIDVITGPQNVALSSPLALVLGSPYYAQVASGSGVVNDDINENCYGSYSVRTSGTVQAIADYENGYPGADLTQWQHGSYGFSLPSGTKAKIEDCTIVLTTLATKSKVREIPGWETSAPGNGTSCVIGYIGE